MKVTIPACVYGKQQGRERAPLEYLVTAPALEKWKAVLLRTIRFQWRSGASGDPETYPDVWFMAPVPGEEGRAFLCRFEDAGRDPRPHTLRSTSGLCTKEHMPLLVAIKQGRARVVSPPLPDGGQWEFEYEPSASAEELPWKAQYLSEGNRGTYDLSFTDEAFAPAPRAEAAAPRTAEPPTARTAAESSARRAPEEPERPGIVRKPRRWCIPVLVTLLVVALGAVFLWRDAESELKKKTEQLADVERELKTMKAHQAQEQAKEEQIKDILRAIQEQGEDMERKGREMRERAGELLNALQQAKRPREEKADPATRSNARSGERTRPREAGPSPAQPAQDEQDEQPEPPPAQPEPAPSAPPSATGESDGEGEEEAASPNESSKGRSWRDRIEDIF